MGATNSGPKDIPKLDSILRSLSSQGILAQTKISIMQQTVAKCLKLSIFSKGAQIPSLLDSDSKVSLICQSYSKEHLLPRIETPTGEKMDAHVLFNLMAANDGQLPVKTYIELDVNFLGLKVLNVGFLILEEPNRVPGEKTPYKTSRHHRLEFDMAYVPDFCGKNIGEEIFNSFECLGGVNPLLFSQLCLYHYAEISGEHNLGVQSIYDQTSDDIHSTPNKLAHLPKKSPTIFPKEGWTDRPSNNRQ